MTNMSCGTAAANIAAFLGELPWTLSLTSWSSDHKLAIDTSNCYCYALWVLGFSDHKLLIDTSNCTCILIVVLYETLL